MEKTFVMIKPDGVRRKLIGEIIRRLETKGFELPAMQMLQINEEMAKEHYQEHQGKEFFPRLIKHITSGPVVAMVWQGEDIIAQVRLMVGHRDPLKAEPGTIRGDYAQISTENLVHAADCIDAAAREVRLFFPGLK